MRWWWVVAVVVVAVMVLLLRQRSARRAVVGRSVAARIEAGRVDQAAAVARIREGGSSRERHPSNLPPPER